MQTVATLHKATMTCTCITHEHKVRIKPQLIATQHDLHVQARYKYCASSGTVSVKDKNPRKMQVRCAEQQGQLHS